MNERHNIYFASDFHLGSPNDKESIIRERKICRWLDNIKKEAKEIYLVGDIFDFWFEYKTVIPKGFERLKGKLANLTDSGVKIHFFPGNHDLWTFGYLEKELGFVVHKKPLITNLNGQLFYITHGDGLGDTNVKYKILKRIFTSRICQFLFGLIHPSIGIKIAYLWSKASRKKGGQINKEKLKEGLLNHSKKILNSHDINYFIYGHIHEPIELQLNAKTKYINLGDWVTHFSFLEFSKNNLLLKYF